LLLFLPAALVVMGVAACTVCCRPSRAESWEQLRARASESCRLGTLSSLMLALAGLGCLDGPAAILGWTMVILGLLGAAVGCIVFKRYLVETGPSRRP
jgi:hypothetical protein